MSNQGYAALLLWAAFACMSAAVIEANPEYYKDYTPKRKVIECVFGVVGFLCWLVGLFVRGLQKVL